MNFDELRNNVGRMFPIEHNEDADHYAFYIDQAVMPFNNRPGDLSRVWKAIRAYDGNTRRPRLAFFYAIANGAPVDDTVSKYYVCKCGARLSLSSEGGCVKCRKPGGKLHISRIPVEVIRCQAPCFDCSVYGTKGTVMGPSCDDFGTPRFVSCDFKAACECSKCCRFEYMRAYQPEELRKAYEFSLSTLPAPVSEAGKAFADDRASFVDINGMLKHLADRKKMEAKK